MAGKYMMMCGSITDGLVRVKVADLEVPVQRSRRPVFTAYCRLCKYRYAVLNGVCDRCTKKMK